MKRVVIVVGIIGVIISVVVVYIRRDVTKSNNKDYTNEKEAASTPPSVDQPPSELLIPIIVAGEKRLLLRATVDHVTTEEKHGVISLFLRGKTQPVVAVNAQLGPPNYRQFVRFRTPRVVNQKEVSFKTYAVKELLSFLTEGKEIQIELGFAPGTDEFDTFLKNFNTYLDSIKANSSNVQPFIMVYPFIKGIELF